MSDAAPRATDQPELNDTSRPSTATDATVADAPDANAALDSMQFAEFREHFIPLRKVELARILAEHLSASPAEQSSFRDLCRLLDSIFHFEFHQVLRDLKEDYSLLDPDSALIELQQIDDKERDRRVKSFMTRLGDLLGRANYRELDQQAIDEAINAATALGVKLRVDFDLFERLHVFVRGDMVDIRTIRNWRTLFRPRQIHLDVFQRLVVMFRLKSDHSGVGDVSRQSVYLKIFKNIPKSDLDMLLPGSKVRMTLLDQIKILVPTISGIAVSLFKIFKVVAALTLLAGASLVAFVGLVVGTIGYGVKSIFGYMRTKEKYNLSVTRHLYFQNLDNNAGVLFRVLNEAEEQEFREAIVAYFLLWREAGESGWTKQELDRRAEEYLHELLGIDIDFEDEDALEKLGRLGLAQCNDQGRWSCVSLPRALECLDRAWDGYYEFHDGGNSPSRSRTENESRT